MTDDVVTIYCCGTGGHRGKGQKWAVPYLYSITTGEERKFICDGPGSARSISKLEKVLKAVETGGKVKLGAKHGSGFFAQKIKGATGEGTADNVVLCMQWLWIQWYSKPFRTINLCGWSRGAVTCIMLAHAIQESGLGDGIPPAVNIFAFDPVPGGSNDFSVKGTFDTTGRAGSTDTLAPCVANYSTILQENIKKMLVKALRIKKDKNFVCTVPRPLGGDTNVELYPLPGGHGDAGKYNEAEGGGCVGRIGIHLAQSFLKEHGTRFDADHTRNVRQLAEDYSEARLQYTDGKTLHKKPPSKYRKNVVVNHFRDHQFYINAHHSGLVEQAYPMVAAMLAGNYPRSDFSEQQEKVLRAIGPRTYSALVQLSLIV